MSNGEIKTRFYQRGDEEEIVALLKKTFPKWAAFKDPIGLWRWKYIETPLESLVTVALVDGKIIGCDNSLVFRAKLGPEVMGLGYSDDVAVDSNYRGRGIWNMIREKRNKVFNNLAKYKFGTTINPVVLRSWVKRKLLLFPFPVTRMIKTKSIDQLLTDNSVKNRNLVKLGYICLKVFNRINNLFKPNIKKIDTFTITEITEFDESIDSFWEKIKNDYSFIIEKKKEHLNWRFTDNDRGKHKIFKALNDEEVLGYVVVGFKPGSYEGLIEDLLALKGRLDVANALFGVACDYLENIGVVTLFYQVVVGHPYHRLSKWHRFIDSRSRPNIQFGYSDDLDRSPIPFLENSKPSCVYFSYATTI